MHEDHNFDADIDLTPLIDVVFLLIIFFVLASTFNKPVMDLILPESKTAQKGTTAEQRADLMIQITKDGRILAENQAFSVDNLAPLVALEPEARMNLFVDREAPFYLFLAVIDEAKKINRTDVVITTEEHE